MRKLTIVLVALFVLLSTILSATAGSSIEEKEKLKPATNKVTGGGTVDWADGRVTYGFTAQIDEKGNVKGEAQFQHRDTGDVTRHAKITALAVDGQGNAWLGGVYTTVPDEPNLVGTEFVFQVFDGGKYDMVSSVALGTSADTASNQPSLYLIPWTNGNVVVE